MYSETREERSWCVMMGRCLYAVLARQVWGEHENTALKREKNTLSTSQSLPVYSQWRRVHEKYAFNVLKNTGDADFMLQNKNEQLISRKKRGRPRTKFKERHREVEKPVEADPVDVRTPSPPKELQTDPPSGQSAASSRRAGLTEMSAVRIGSPSRQRNGPPRGRGRQAMPPQKAYILPPRSEVEWFERGRIPFAKIPEWFEFEVFSPFITYKTVLNISTNSSEK